MAFILRTFLLVTVVGFAGPISLAGRPNVLMIAVDDLRPELNCYGVSHIHSPHIDRLAAEGVRFDHAYCQVAVCGASRASLLSGCRPETVGIWDYKTPLRSKMPDVLTLPGHFKASGYETATLGKVYHNRSDDAESWTVDVNQIAPADPKLGKSWLKIPYHKRKPLPGGGKFKMGPSTENGGNVDDEAYVDGHLAARATKVLEHLADEDDPFFFAVGFLKPHLPFVAPEKYWGLYDRENIIVPSKLPMPGSVPWARSGWGELKNYPDIGHEWDVLDDETSRRLIHGYYAATSYMDAQVGKLLDALERTGLVDNTIVVLWGDHGWFVGDYGDWCKHANYEVATRVPLIWRVPEAVANVSPATSEALVELVDIYPTLCEVTGTDVPGHLQGHSMMPVLRDAKRDWKPAAISQYMKREPDVRHDGQLVRKGGMRRGTSVRTDRFRYTRWQVPKSGEVVAEELVDLQTEPRANRIDDPTLAGELPRLRRLATQASTGVAPTDR